MMHEGAVWPRMHSHLEIGGCNMPWALLDLLQIWSQRCCLLACNHPDLEGAQTWSQILPLSDAYLSWLLAQSREESKATNILVSTINWKRGSNNNNNNNNKNNSNNNSNNIIVIIIVIIIISSNNNNNNNNNNNSNNNNTTTTTTTTNTNNQQQQRQLQKQQPEHLSLFETNMSCSLFQGGQSKSCR